MTEKPQQITLRCLTLVEHQCRQSMHTWETSQRSITRSVDTRKSCLMPRNDDEWDDMEEEIDGMEILNPHKQVEEHQDEDVA